MKRIFCFVTLCSVCVAGTVLRNSVDDGIFKRQIYSVNIVGAPKVDYVNTLSKPILTPQTIAVNVKESVLKIETLDLGSPDSYISKIQPLFTDEFFGQMKANLDVRATYYIKNLVRVMDFIVTKPPMYIGSESGKVRSWTFYLEGVYGLKGFGTMNSTGTRRIFVTVQESKGADGNPMGVRISNYNYV